MGCWNGTCGVSGLPIDCGEKIKFVIVRARPATQMSGVCYATDTADVISCVFDGSYNDYGRPEGIKSTSEFEYFIDRMKKKLKSGKMELLPDDYYDARWKGEAEDIIEAIERDRVYEDIAGEKYNVGIYMIKLPIYESLKPTYQVKHERYHQMSDWLTEASSDDRVSSEAIKEVVNLIVGVDQVRQTFSPKSGKGGQVYEYDAFDRLSRAMAKESHRMKKAQEEIDSEWE